jgi:hypothetical protein
MWSLKIASVALMLGLALAARSEGIPDVNRPRQGIGPVEVLREHSAFLLEARGTGALCRPDKPEVCKIKVKSVSGGQYCLAVAQNVQIDVVVENAPEYNRRPIIWEIVDFSAQPQPIDKVDGEPIAFHADAGIIELYDDDAQIYHGNIGDGSGAANPGKYHMTTRRSKKGATAGYLPVIIWGPRGDEKLCAAIDPKIVNAN